MSRARRLAVVWLLALLAAWPAAARSVPLTILHTNDTHGHLLPFSYPAIVPAGSELEPVHPRADIGGIARRATIARSVRDELARRRAAVWLVDAGDFSDGTPFSTEYHGEADVEAMNAAGYTMGTLGNHEFSGELAELRKVLALARFPLVCANATDSATGKPLVLPFLVRTVGPVRVGVFGLLTTETTTYRAAKEGIAIGDPVDAARRTVAALRKRADIILLLSHLGEGDDERLAHEVPGIDVIVGGHSHSRLPTGGFVWRSEDLKANEVNGTVIVQDHQWGGELGRLDLLFDQDATGRWHVDRYRERLIPVTAEIAPAPDVRAVVDRYWQPIASRFTEVIGQAAADFSSRGEDEAHYNLVADAVRATFGTDVDLENLGGIRAPLVQGTIARGDLVAMDPFGNTVVLFQVTGRELKALLEKHVPAVSGVRYRVENRRLVEATLAGTPIEDERVYNAASNSFFAQYALKGLSVRDTGRTRLDVLIDYVRQRGTVQPSYDGRRVVVRTTPGPDDR